MATLIEVSKLTEGDEIRSLYDLLVAVQQSALNHDTNMMNGINETTKVVNNRAECELTATGLKV